MIQKEQRDRWIESLDDEERERAQELEREREERNKRRRQRELMQSGFRERATMTSAPRVIDDHIHLPDNSLLTNLARLKPPKGSPASVSEISMLNLTVNVRLFGGRDWDDTLVSPTNTQQTTNKNPDLPQVKGGGMGVRIVDSYDPKQPPSSSHHGSANSTAPVYNPQYDHLSNPFADLPNSYPSSHMVARGYRQTDRVMELRLKGFNIRVDQFGPREQMSNRTVIAVDDIEIVDYILTSPFKTFLGYYHSFGKGREMGSSMLWLEMLNVRPDPTRQREELRAKLSILPIRLNIDQDALEFIIDFFSHGASEEAPSDKTENVDAVISDTNVDVTNIQVTNASTFVHTNMPANSSSHQSQSHPSKEGSIDHSQQPGLYFEPTVYHRGIHELSSDDDDDDDSGQDDEQSSHMVEGLGHDIDHERPVRHRRRDSSDLNDHYGARPLSADELIQHDHLTNTSQSSTAHGEVALQTYIQSFQVTAPIHLCIDWKPKRINFRGLQGGDWGQLANLFALENMKIDLKSVKLTGLPGWDRVGSQLLDAWVHDISRHQAHRYLASVQPIRSVVNIGSGVSDLVVMPISHYKHHGQLTRGVQRGLTSFLKQVSLESMSVAARLAQGAQTILESVDDAITTKPTPLPQHALHQQEAARGRMQQKKQRSTSNASSSSSSSNRSRSHPYISKMSGPPSGYREGFRQAYESFSRGLRAAAQQIIVIPREEYQKYGGKGAAKSVIKALPSAVLSPVIGSLEGVSKALMGVHSSLDPKRKKELDDKYKTEK